MEKSEHHAVGGRPKGWQGRRGCRVLAMAGSCCSGGDLDYSGESWIVEFEALKQIVDGTPITEKGKRFAKYGKTKIKQ